MIESTVGDTDNGAIMSRTAAGMAVDQFRRLKLGDRFWYENSIHEWSATDLVELEAATLKAIIEEHFPSLAGTISGSIFEGIHEYN
jgi:hypothetical protein